MKRAIEYYGKSLGEHYNASTKVLQDAQSGPESSLYHGDRAHIIGLKSISYSFTLWVFYRAAKKNETVQLLWNTETLGIVKYILEYISKFEVYKILPNSKLLILLTHTVCNQAVALQVPIMY